MPESWIWNGSMDESKSWAGWVCWNTESEVWPEETKEKNGNRRGRLGWNEMEFKWRKEKNICKRTGGGTDFVINGARCYPFFLNGGDFSFRQKLKIAPKPRKIKTFFRLLASLGRGSFSRCGIALQKRASVARVKWLLQSLEGLPSSAFTWNNYQKKLYLDLLTSGFKMRGCFAKGFHFIPGNRASVAGVHDYSRACSGTQPTNQLTREPAQ